MVSRLARLCSACGERCGRWSVPRHSRARGTHRLVQCAPDRCFAGVRSTVRIVDCSSSGALGTDEKTLLRERPESFFILASLTHGTPVTVIFATGHNATRSHHLALASRPVSDNIPTRPLHVSACARPLSARATYRSRPLRMTMSGGDPAGGGVA